VSNPAVKATLTETSPGMSFSIKLEIPPEYKPAEGDKITFKTDNKDFASMTVPMVESNFSQGTFGGATPTVNPLAVTPRPGAATPAAGGGTATLTPVAPPTHASLQPVAGAKAAPGSPPAPAAPPAANRSRP
jgi:hypothetical protein